MKLIRKDVPLGLFDRAQPAAAEVTAGVVVACLLTAHTSTGGTQLGTEPSLSSSKSRDETQREKVIVSASQQRRDGRIWRGDRARVGREYEVEVRRVIARKVLVAVC